MSSLFCGIPSDVDTPPCHTVDLDQPAKTRWNHILSLYIEKIRQVEKQIDSMIEKALGSWILSILDAIVSSIMSGVTRLGLVYYGEELKGFAELTGISLGRMVLIQFVYECFACCTSIVCRDPVTNTPLHIRTMDWGLDFLKDLTIDVDFQRKGQSIVKATTWIGYVGILTGMRCNKGFSVSVNFRQTDGTFAANLEKALTRGWPIGFLLREVFERTNDYSTAVEYLAQSTLIAPCYFSICGSRSNDDPGTLITRNQEAEEQRWTLIKNGPIVQTNIDHWSSNAEQDILHSLGRRMMARKWLDESGKHHVTEESLWDLISRYPILNDITIYGTFMCPEYGIYHTRFPHSNRGFKSLDNQRYDPIDGIPDESSLFSSSKIRRCIRCDRDFTINANLAGDCVHRGEWHSKYQDCSYIKCGIPLAKKFSIGLAHWSCCYSLDPQNQTCKKSLPHTNVQSKE